MYDTKDYGRMVDILDKEPSKRSTLATKMAKLITDANKCHRRMEAAMEVFGSNHNVANIFKDRYTQLTGQAPQVIIKHEPLLMEVETEEEETPPPPPAPKVEPLQIKALEIVPDPEPGEDRRIKKGIGGKYVETWVTYTQEKIYIYRENPSPVDSKSTNFYNGSEFLFGAKRESSYQVDNLLPHNNAYIYTA